MAARSSWTRSVSCRCRCKRNCSRVLETGDIRRLGDNQTVHVNVRIVCATHRDLEKMVEEGTFREDLMFRINTFEIRVPSLRERTEDIPLLAQHLLRRHRTDGSDDHSLPKRR